MNVSSWRAVNADPPGPHGLGNLPNQLDLEQAIVEGGALHLHVIRKIELSFELSGRNASVEEFTLGLFGLAAFDGDDVLLGRDRNLIGRETGNRHRDLVAILGKPFDVVRRVAVLGGALGCFNEVKEAIEADGRSEERREV